jgi:hypothetical protein
MEKTLRIINTFQEQGILKEYAIGGAIAAMYYIEPILTYDLDIFFIPPEERLDVLAPIYEQAERKGYIVQKETIMIEGVPVQFIPAYNDLVKEAVKSATDTNYRETKTYVVKPEYLIAIAVQTNRPKDRERAVRLLNETAIDSKLLMNILGRFRLTVKFDKFKSQFYEKKSR